MPTSPERDARAVTLTLVAISTALSLIIFTIPLTTINAVTQDLRLTAGEIAWIMSGMPLGCAVGLLTSGALGDTYGRKKVFLGGLLITVVASIVAALAESGLVLILARVVQGLGNAGVMACGLGLLGQVYHGEERARATAIWAASLGSGVAIGPILASICLSLGGWQAIQWVAAIASGALALASLKPLPKSERIPERIDLLGSILMMAGMAFLLSALTQLRMGISAEPVLMLLASAVLIIAFCFLELRVRNPIIQLDLFRRADFVGATLAAFASGAGVLSIMTMVPTVLERSLGIRPLFAATILLAWSAITVVAALAAQYLPRSLSARNRVVLGMVGCIFGQLLLLLMSGDYIWPIALPGLFVSGVANGILNASLGHAAVESVPVERVAMGSAANNTARYLGSAIGITVSAVLISNAGPYALSLGWQEAVLATTGFSVLGLLVMLLLDRRSARKSMPT
ncbi:Predicted arabinose efflux permease, MFS family [Cohaesibacter marisflavi]|uniref:Predicted arabinose efflux permease, MFS family n=1 Tax=Cohaesibacter marisflavi TaxID=655353 RepID=A0A1I5EY98_9HYPH|nr:MFS transporter [Cohaesibacter marisflavi]SFO16041.1 Predicted arabinose efflux permease, MFS family [Cohaesibacter marisflavi]